MELVQWRVISESPKCTFVPGVQRFAVERAPRPSPPSNCTSSEIGKVLIQPHALAPTARAP